MEAVADSVLPSRNKRRYRTVAERRSIVEETYVPGVSVATIARAHGVNANQVFAWRKMYEAGLFSSVGSDVRRRRRATTCDTQSGDHGEAVTSSVRLLPVTVTSEIEPTSESSVIPKKQEISEAPSGTIELTLSKARVRITGAVDAAVLRIILESVRA